MDTGNEKVALAALDEAFSDSVKNVFRVLMVEYASVGSVKVQADAVERARNGLVLAARTRDDIAAMIKVGGQDVLPQV